MKFEGNFYRIVLPGMNNISGAGHLTDSFVLTCKGGLFERKKQQVVVEISDYYRKLQPRTYNMEVKPGSSYTFNIKTVDWDWHQGDFFRLFDTNNQLLGEWICYRKEYSPGECPECHGTKKCSKCKGKNLKFDHDYNVIWCSHCAGTGECPTCTIFYRKSATGADIHIPNPSIKVDNNIYQQINSVQAEINKVRQTMFQMKLSGKGYSSEYSRLEKYLADLNAKLEALEQHL